MGDPWGIGGFRGGGEKPKIKQIVKKNGPKNPRNREKNWKNLFFFLLKMV